MSQIAVFDTSALIKRYLSDESNSEVVGAIFKDGAIRPVISRLVGIEMAAALTRRELEGDLAAADRSEAWTSVLEHMRDEYRIVAIDDSVCGQAEELVATTRLRTLDAIHVATALLVLARLDESDSLVFVTADRRQAATAREVGLAVQYLGD